MPMFWTRTALALGVLGQIWGAGSVSAQPYYLPQPAKEACETEPGRAHVGTPPVYIPGTTTPFCPTPYMPYPTPPSSQPGQPTPATPAQRSPMTPESPETPMQQTPETQTPQTQTPETQTPQTPESQTPQTQTPQSQTPQSQTPQTQSQAPDFNPSFGQAQGGLGQQSVAFSPNMMGDLLRSYRGVTFQYLLAGDGAVSNSSGAVTFRNSSIAENNSAIPRDRVFFRYNYFHNALDVRGLKSAGRGPTTQSTIGLIPGQTPVNFDDPNTFRTFRNPANSSLQPGDNLFFLDPTSGQQFLIFPLVVDGVPAFLPNGDLNPNFPFIPLVVPGVVTTPQAAGLPTTDGLSNVTEVFVQPGARSYDVHLYTPGFEKTLWNGHGSIEFRFPIAQSVNSDLDLRAGSLDPDSLFVQATPGATLGSSDVAFQDFQGILKLVLHQSKRVVVSGGFGVTAPTGPDLSVRVVDFSNNVGLALDPRDPETNPFSGLSVGVQAIDRRVRNFEVENETWEMSPFLAMALQPSKRTFINGFAQVDVPLNSSSWSYNSVNVDTQIATGLVTGLPLGVIDPNGNIFVAQGGAQPLTNEVGAIEDVEHFRGRIKDQTLLHANLGGGYWLYQNPRNRVLNGVASFFEAHYTTTLEDADIVDVPAKRLRANRTDAPELQPQIGNTANRVDILNGTVGMHLLLGNTSTLSAGYAFPFRTDEGDKTFDGELNVQLNYYFGGPINRPLFGQSF